MRRVMFVRLSLEAQKVSCQSVRGAAVRVAPAVPGGADVLHSFALICLN